MLFHGGLIPTYLVVRELGLLNTVWAMILPCAVNVFNMLLVLSFFLLSILLPFPFPFTSLTNHSFCLYPLTLPSVIPDTKYLCRNG